MRYSNRSFNRQLDEAYRQGYRDAMRSINEDSDSIRNSLIKTFNSNKPSDGYYDGYYVTWFDLNAVNASDDDISKAIMDFITYDYKKTTKNNPKVLIIFYDMNGKYRDALEDFGFDKSIRKDLFREYWRTDATDEYPNGKYPDIVFTSNIGHIDDILMGLSEVGVSVISMNKSFNSKSEVMRLAKVIADQNNYHLDPEDQLSPDEIMKYVPVR